MRPVAESSPSGLPRLLRADFNGSVPAMTCSPRLPSRGCHTVRLLMRTCRLQTTAEAEAEAEALALAVLAVLVLDAVVVAEALLGVLEG